MAERTDPTYVTPVVLMYHGVCADGAPLPDAFAVTASTFRRQMAWLAARGCWTPRLADVLHAGGRAPCAPGRPVILTFDDGYADNLANALPTLRAHGFTAAFFPVLDLRRRFNHWDPGPGAPLLGARDLTALEEAGMQVGSHTMTHPWLTRASPAQLAEELARSREVLASLVAHPLPVLAYPYGAVDGRVKAAARAAGYEAGLAVNSGPLELGADPFEIRRVQARNRSGAAYLSYLVSGAGKVYAWSRWKLGNGLAAMTGGERDWTSARGARRGEATCPSALPVK